MSAGAKPGPRTAASVCTLPGLLKAQSEAWPCKRLRRDLRGFLMTQHQNPEDITPTAAITITSKCCNFFKVWVSLPFPSTCPQVLTLALCLTTVVSFPMTVGGYRGRSARLLLSWEYEDTTQEFVKPCVSHLSDRHPALSQSPWSPEPKPQP